MRRWNARLTSEGETLLARAARLGGKGPYQLMAAIHAAHASRRHTGTTPWPGILALYDALVALRPDPVTLANRAVALGEVAGVPAGLAELDTAARMHPLDRWLPFHAARAALLLKAGRRLEARAAYVAALALAPPPAKARYLTAQLAAL